MSQNGSGATRPVSGFLSVFRRKLKNTSRPMIKPPNHTMTCDHAGTRQFLRESRPWDTRRGFTAALSGSHAPEPKVTDALVKHGSVAQQPLPRMQCHTVLTLQATATREAGTQAITCSSWLLAVALRSGRRARSLDLRGREPANAGREGDVAKQQARPRGQAGERRDDTAKKAQGHRERQEERQVEH